MLSRLYGGKIPYAGDRVASTKGAPLHAKCRIDVIDVNCMRVPQRFPGSLELILDALDCKRYRTSQPYPP